MTSTDPTPAPPLRRVLLLVAAAYPLVYLAMALRRVPYPFELEWMEGGALDHVRRLLAHQPLYVAPSIDFVPYIYTPLYFHVAAWCARVMGVGLPALRTVSFLASLACFALLFELVRRGTGRAWAGFLAACLYAATFRRVGAWFDVARADSLSLALALAAFLALIAVRPARGSGALAGVLFGLAFLAKQSGLVVGLPLLAALAFIDRRRAATMAVTLALVAGGASLWLDRASHGWYAYYVFELPRAHPIEMATAREFWRKYLFGPALIAMLAGAFYAAGRTTGDDRGVRRPLVLAFAAGLVGTAFLSIIRDGGYDNLVMPAYAALALLFGFGLGAIEDALGARAPSTDAVRRFVYAACLFQFALFAYDPRRQIPTAADRRATQAVVDTIRAHAGEVWVPRHGYLAALAGKRGHAHAIAVDDVLRGPPRGREMLRADIGRALATRRFGAIVLDDHEWLQAEVDSAYAPASRLAEGRVMWPVTGMATRPQTLYLPKPSPSP